MNLVELHNQKTCRHLYELRSIEEFVRGELHSMNGREQRAAQRLQEQSSYADSAFRRWRVEDLFR